MSTVPVDSVNAAEIVPGIPRLGPFSCTYTGSTAELPARPDFGCVHCGKAINDPIHSAQRKRDVAQRFADVGLAADHAAGYAHEIDRALAKRYPGSTGTRLSPKEARILRMIVQGAQRMQIAERLQLSPKTIDQHRANILRKLGCANDVALVLRVIADGTLVLREGVWGIAEAILTEAEAAVAAIGNAERTP